MRTVADVVASYIDHTRKLAPGPNSRTWMNVRSHLARLTLAARQLDPPTIRRALAQLETNTDLSVVYRRDAWNTWLRFLRWSAEWGEISAEAYMQAQTFSPRFATRGEQEQRPLPTVAQIIDDLARLTPRDRDFIRLLLLTAARPSELLTLRTIDINTAGSPWLAALHHHKTRAKTGAPRYLAFNHKAALILDRYLRPFCPLDYLFQSQTDPRRPCAVNTIAQRLRRKSVRFCLYDCRRLAARHLRSVGDLDAAQAVLGHTKASTTEIYAPVDVANITEGAELLAGVLDA